MDIETSSAIKLFFPNPSLSLVYFEAIANALDAEADQIKITISVDSFKNSETLQINIEDNGQGFNDSSFERFKTLMKPKDLLHKGIGRLVFLNYFQRVEVESVWPNQSRKFVFTEDFDDQCELVDLNSPVINRTILRFQGFAKEKVKSYDDLRPAALKEKIIAHFLLTLTDLQKRFENFRIEIRLNTVESNVQKEFFSNSVTITKADLPIMEHKQILDEKIDAHSCIDMHYYVQETTSPPNLLVAINVDGRTIPVDIIRSAAIPFGHSAAFIFSSELFAASSDSSRQKLVLSPGLSESLIYAVMRREIGAVLSKFIPEIAEGNERTKEKFEMQFPHLLGYFDENSVGLIDSEDALNSAQQKFFKVQKEILQCDDVTDEIYLKSLEASARTLTEYVLYREKIIAKMGEMTAANSEAEIHNLIVPRWEKFEQRSVIDDIYQNNAWLLDDKFMTFRTILSEARMDRVIAAIRSKDEILGYDGRPDITMIFSADPNDEVAVDVVVVEIKKKTDDEKENQYAINQLLDRARKLADHCPNIQRIWYYAVLEVNNEFARSLRQQEWTSLFSKGQVLYRELRTERFDGKLIPTPICILSFDAIVADAQARNHTFLEILRASMKKHISMERLAL